MKSKTATDAPNIITTDGGYGLFIASGPRDVPRSRLINALIERFGPRLNIDEGEWELTGNLQHLYCRRIERKSGSFLWLTKNCA